MPRKMRPTASPPLEKRRMEAHISSLASASSPRARRRQVPAPRVEPFDRRARAESDRAEWETLLAEIRPCTRCHLARTRTQTVIYRGSLAPYVVFVGEAPGAEEDRQGLPFVGRAGKKLDGAIDRMGLRSTEYGILNLFKCRPPGNVFDERAASECRPFLARQLAWLQPQLLVCLGRHALAAFVPDPPSLTRAEGYWYRWGSVAVFPMVHPAATFRARAWSARWERDIERLHERFARLHVDSSAKLLYGDGE